MIKIVSLHRETLIFNYLTSILKIYCIMSICIKCLKRNECESIRWSPDSYHLSCNDFVYDKRKRFLLIHHYVETCFDSVVAFSDSYNELDEVAKNHPRFGSSRHLFSVVNNFPSNQGLNLTLIKDRSLVNICKNVAEYLSVAEYAMLKKSYYKSSAWFEKAKNAATLGAVIIDNY